MKSILYGAALPIFALGAFLSFAKGAFFPGVLFSLAALGALTELGGLKFLLLLFGLSWLFEQSSE